MTAQPRPPCGRATRSPARSNRAAAGYRDRGSAALETVALLPLVILVGSLLFQLGVAVWATNAADTAARSAARAVTLGGDALTAANSSLPGALRVAPGDITTVSGRDEVRVTLRVGIPRVSVLPDLTVQRGAVMPDIRP